MGLPDTDTVNFWLDEEKRADFPEELTVKKSELKNPEIPLLND